MMLDIGLLRLFWSVVEDVRSQDLVSVSDTALIAMLLQQVSRRVLLNGEESRRLCEYIGAKLPLIRDMADQRQAQYLSEA